MVHSINFALSLELIVLVLLNSPFLVDSFLAVGTLAFWERFGWPYDLVLHSSHVGVHFYQFLQAKAAVCSASHPQVRTCQKSTLKPLSSHLRQCLLPLSKDVFHETHRCWVQPYILHSSSSTYISSPTCSYLYPAGYQPSQSTSYQSI